LITQDTSKTRRGDNHGKLCATDGKCLAQHDRDYYVLSTTVGRLVLDEVDTDERDSEMFKFGLVNRVVYDYTEKGALKSIEGSLNRLGVDRLDFVFVHDPAQDFHGDAWLAQLETARTGTFRALARLREEGVITGWGLGVNLTEPVEFALGLTGVQPDSTLLAGRYTLLDHEHALQRLMPTAAAQGIDIVIGGAYNSGILAGGTRFEYQTAPAQITAKVARITDIAQRHNVPIKAAALQFSLAHPATAAVIPGASKPERIAEDYAALYTTIPDDFWHEMRDQHLVAANAPLPIDRYPGNSRGSGLPMFGDTFPTARKGVRVRAGLGMMLAGWLAHV
jgi:D-threo-aldose 1-dehydrogenase